MKKFIKFFLIVSIIVHSFNIIVRAEEQEYYDFDTLKNNAESEVRAGNYTDALYYYNKLITINNDNEYAYFLRGMFFLFDVSNYKKAIEDFTSAININPYYIVGYLSRGCARTENNDYNGAILDFTKAINLSNKSNAFAYAKRSRVYAINKNYRLAISDATTSIKLQQKNPEAFYSRGISEYFLGVEIYPNNNLKGITLLESSKKDLFYAKEQYLELKELEAYNITLEIYKKVDIYLRQVQHPKKLIYTN